jgi:hypothetical protein
VIKNETAAAIITVASVASQYLALGLPNLDTRISWQQAHSYANQSDHVLGSLIRTNIAYDREYLHQTKSATAAGIRNTMKK